MQVKNVLVEFELLMEEVKPVCHMHCKNFNFNDVIGDSFREMQHLKATDSARSNVFKT